MRIAKVSTLILICIVFATACATVGIKDYSTMTPKEKAYFFLATYNKADAEYRIQAVMPNLTDKDKELLRAKKAVMVEVYPLIDAYKMAVEQNVTIPPTLEPLILSLLNRLGTKLGG
ncbi:hypothetical protein [Candidatus Magnetobacterium casense]|uniref:Lipoprotein n=1 Tax=Candidatus Magnetobacterium casense TaxID=1455061 RepID=A0ABS6S4T3_9BACT|nr:hypothetical protein [Candidatus Magnetobacterium casensis]MBV6343418.1 hypothetical protein [Candidatus Magnetobacterium casensis]